MPTRKLYIQASFEQGMIDTVSFDYDYEDSDLKFQLPQNRGALLIENFDPSIVRGALTKRYGYGYVRTLDWNTDAGLIGGVGVPTAFGQSNVINVDIDRYTFLIDTDPDTNPVGSQTDKVTFLGATAVPYNKPIGQNVVVFFLRDIKNPGGTNEERTIVLNYSSNLQDETARWRNPHIDGLNNTGTIRGTLQPSVYPGWDVSGTYTDHARHGGNLVITTDVAIDLAPNNTGNFDYAKQWVKDKMYPCYVWTYWDLRRKRSDNRKFWNIIGTLPNPLSDLTSNYSVSDKYSQFKVMYPSQYVTRNAANMVSFKAYVTGQCLTDTKVISSPVSTYLPQLATDIPQAAVEIVAIEFKGREYSATPPTFAWTPNFVAPEKLSSVYTWVYGKEYSSHIQSIEVLNAFPIANDGTARWKVQYKGYKPNGDIGQIDVQTIDISRGDSYREGKVIAITTNQTKIANGETGSDEQSVTGKSYYWVVGVQLPNYLESNNPRPWLKGEQIPWVCTFKIRGAEVVAQKGVYTVQQNANPAYPSMWWLQDDYQNTNRTDYNLGLLPVPPLVYTQAPSDNSIKQQFALFKTQTAKLNGNNYVVAGVRGYSYRVTGYVGASKDYPADVQNNFVSGLGRDYYAYPDLQPYCYEPFNPTTSIQFVADVAKYESDPLYNANYLAANGKALWVFHWHLDIAPHYLPSAPTAPSATTPGLGDFVDNNKAGYRKDHTAPNLIYFTIKIKKTEIPKLLDMGVEAINFYVAEPGEDSQFRSVGLQNIGDPLPGVYMLPTTTDFEDLSKYRLVKSHVLDGDGQPLYNWNEYNNWKEKYTGFTVDTNCWLSLQDSIISVGQQKDSTPLNEVDCSLTPDFILWDYPATSTPLQLNSSGKYWQGIGARCVTNIKGRTFLAGCIDKYGEEEQAIIRYSDIQSGVIALDIFSEEGYLKVGGLPHTAMLEYREQLWTFSRHECHRIQMPTIGDVSTWEYLDKIPGQGTFSPKTTITTPDGVFWCNESGVWLSDGRMPSNIAEPVLTYYKAMATDTPPYYATQVGLPRFPYNDDGFNPYMELSYDESRNELIVSSPIAEMITQGESGTQPIAQNAMQEYRLIFSFSSKTWRVEYIDLPTFGTPLNIFDTTGTLAF